MSQIYPKTWAESGEGKGDIPEKTGNSNQDEGNRCWTIKTADAHQETTEAKSCVGAWTQNSSSSSGRSMELSLGTLWAGACELLIPHGHSCGFNYLYPSSTFHLRRCSVNLAQWNQKEQRKGREGRREEVLAKKGPESERAVVQTGVLCVLNPSWFCALQLSS